MTETTGEGLRSKVDNVLDLQQDEKLKVQLEIRKMTSDLKKEVQDTKKTEAIKAMDTHFNDLLHTGTVERSKLDAIKKDIENKYTSAKISNLSGPDSAEQNIQEAKVVEDATDNLVADVNNLAIKETKKDISTGALDTTADTQQNIDKKLQEVKAKQKDIEDSIKESLTTIDGLAEAKYTVWNPRAQMTKEQQDIAFTAFAHDVADAVNVQLLTVEERARMGYRFELKTLKDAIIASTGGTGPDASSLYHKPGQEEEKNREINANYGDLFKDTYPVNIFNAGRKPDIYNIYKDGKMKEVMDKILDSNDSLKLKEGVFGVNLSLDSGLAGIVATLDKGQEVTIGSYKFAVEGNKIQILSGPDGVRTDRKITGKDLKAMDKAGLISYTHQKGFLQIDDEFAKMAKILNTAKWEDLQTFVALSAARSDQSNTLKEFVNTKEALSILSTGNVFDFLCDRNGDKTVGYDKAKNKKQENIGDVGNIFGQQLKYTLDQAVNVQEVLHPGQGEQIVIQNIMANVDLQDSRKTSPALAEEFAKYANNLSYCTKENLVASIKKYPEFKAFFGAAIEKINGSDSILTPDLYDTLTGNAVNRLMENDDWKFRKSLEISIDKQLKAKNITGDTIKIRENLITKIMNIADGFTIVGSDSQEGYLRNPGVSKEFSNKEAKRAFINDLTNKTLNSIAVGVFSPENSIRIPVDFIKQGHSENGRVLWRVNAGPSIGYNRETQDIIITLGAGGEVAEQYNYNRVINAGLDDVKSAKYLGAEARAIAGLQNHTVTAEASAGLNWQQDPIMGINQINRQYESLSKQIFTLKDSDLTSYEDIYKTIAKKIDLTDGAYKEFAKTNKNRLLANADFVVSFLAANKVLETVKEPRAIKELISILQEGNMEQWRSDLLNNIHGKLDITKLSFGVTTNALTIACGQADKSTTTPGSSNTATSPDTDINSFNNNGTTYKFGIAGFYVGARLSNWKTAYRVNALQLANTRSEIAEGRNVDQIALKTPEEYAKYLSALFNRKDLSFDVVDGKLTISNKTGIKLPTLLSIRVTKEASSQIKYEARANDLTDRLTIGNVKDMGAYTTAEADGVVRQLCIGSKNYRNGIPLGLLNTTANTVDAIKMKKEGEYEPVTSSDITDLVNKGIESETDRAVLLSCFDTNGQLKKDISGVTIENAGIISASTAIIFRKDKEGKYILSLGQGTPGKLGLRFADGERFANGEVADFKTSEYKVESPAIKKALDALETKDYANLEKRTGNGVSRDFVRFMDYCDSDLNKASAALWRMLPDTGKFAEIKETLTNARLNKDKKTERYLVDQFKGLFAYETSYEGKTIGQIFKPRGDHFLGLLKDAPDSLKKTIKTMRDELVKENSTAKYSELKTNVATIPELFGYTAFYRKQVNTDGKKFSLVSTADTTVMPVGGKSYSVIENDAGKQTKEWITTNLDKNEEQKALLLDTVLSNIKDENTRAEFAKELTTEKLAELLKTGKFTLDNGLKRIILSTTPAFYFKGECANESLGLVIDKLEIQEAPVNEAEKQLASNFNVAGRSHSVAAKPSVKVNNVSGLYYGELQKGSYTRAGSDGEGTDDDTDVGGTDNNKF